MNSPWDSVGSGGRLHTARYAFPGGVSRSTIVALHGDARLVYSPGDALLESAEGLIAPDAEVLLVAPCAAHTLGLARWRDHFPRAMVVAVEGVRERVRQQAGLAEVRPLSEAEPWMPAQVRLHVPPACAMGEAWVSVEHDDRVYWLVADSIMNIAALADRFWLRWLQRLYGLKVGLSVGRMFRASVSDREGFRRWARARFDDGREHVLVPCHGEIDARPGLGARLVALIERRF